MLIVTVTGSEGGEEVQVRTLQKRSGRPRTQSEPGKPPATFNVISEKITRSESDVMSNFSSPRSFPHREAPRASPEIDNISLSSNYTTASSTEQDYSEMTVHVDIEHDDTD